MYLKYLMPVIGMAISCMVQAAGNVAHPGANADKGSSAVVAPATVGVATPRGDIHVTPASTPTGGQPMHEPSSGWYVVDSTAPSTSTGSDIPPPPPPPEIVTPPPPYFPPPEPVQ